MTKRVVCEVSADGTAKWEFGGFQGKDCLTIEAKIEQYLREEGIVIEDKSVKMKTAGAGVSSTSRQTVGN